MTGVAGGATLLLSVGLLCARRIDTAALICALQALSAALALAETATAAAMAPRRGRRPCSMAFQCAWVTSVRCSAAYSSWRTLSSR